MADEQTDRRTDGQIDRWTGRQAVGQARQTDRMAGRQIDKIIMYLQSTLVLMGSSASSLGVRGYPFNLI
jgi:hypothetical protein